MNVLPAHDEITLALGGDTLRLRPSLRAATYLERLHDGLPALLQRVAEFHTGTIRQIIAIASTDRAEASAFLSRLDKTPLKIAVDAVTSPILELCAAFIPTSDSSKKPAKPGNPMPWAEVYRQLFRTATGWLQWEPETAWNATPTEINEAFAGHIAKLKALHGNPDKEDSEAEAYSAERIQEVEELGYDPDFDRSGLQSLKLNAKKRTA